MALCHNCNRMLSANGSCLYCGTTAGRDSVMGGPPRRRVNWLRRILLIVLAALLVHFFIISPTGRELVRPLLEKVGVSL